MNLPGQYIPGSSFLHRMDPRAKLLGFLLLVVAVISARTAPAFLLLTVFVLALAHASGLPRATVFGTVRRMYSLMGFILVLNAFFFTTDDPLWKWWIFSFSLEGVRQGILVAARLLLIMVLGNLLTLTTRPLELTGAIGWFLSPLGLVKVPVDEVAVILSVAIQFIPTLMEETEAIKKAQIARGARFESRKLHERAAAMLPLVVPIFLAAFKRADELAMAMEARGYRGARHRSPRPAPAMQRRSWATIFVCTALCVFSIVA